MEKGEGGMARIKTREKGKGRNRKVKRG